MTSSTGSAPQPRVLVVDDEEHITELVAMGLGYNGFDVRAGGYRAGRRWPRSRRRRPDLIVLDVMLPDLDGFEVARRLRESEGAGTRVPVIFLTARDATQDKIQGLRLGSDDYVTKPFSIEELVERVKAVLRRASGTGPGEHRLSYADLELDEDTREVWRDGRLIELTPTEYKLLYYLLVERPPRAHTRPDPRARVGLHLRRQRQRPRDLHQLPAPQDRRRGATADPHRSRRRLQPASPAGPRRLTRAEPPTILPPGNRARGSGPGPDRVVPRAVPVARKWVIVGLPGPATFPDIAVTRTRWPKDAGPRAKG